jgi:hypothetical protein
MRRRPIQDGFNPLAHPIGGHPLVGPNRLDAAEHVLSVDLRDRQIADDRIDVALEGAAPLSAVSGVAPFAFAVGYHGLGRATKCQAGQLLLGALALALVDWIDAVED